MGRFFMLVFALEVVLVVLAMISCLAAERGQVRTLPRIAWVAVILLVPLLGPTVYFLAGRPARVGRGGILDNLGQRTGGAPPTTGSKRTVAPDDDPEFLRRLNRKSTTDDQELLRRWEEELRRREGDLPKRDDTPPADS
ncbi:MAG TPA: PLD nuclease N-terminal domain-containing protein [Micromonosporaceae bacterium]